MPWLRLELARTQQVAAASSRSSARSRPSSGSPNRKGWVASRAEKSIRSFSDYDPRQGWIPGEGRLYPAARHGLGRRLGHGQQRLASALGFGPKAASEPMPGRRVKPTLARYPALARVVVGE